jgi:hypothetical protein
MSRPVLPACSTTLPPPPPKPPFWDRLARFFSRPTEIPKAAPLPNDEASLRLLEVSAIPERPE